MITRSAAAPPRYEPSSSTPDRLIVAVQHVEAIARRLDLVDDVTVSIEVGSRTTITINLIRSHAAEAGRLAYQLGLTDYVLADGRFTGGLHRWRGQHEGFDLLVVGYGPLAPVVVEVPAQ